MNFNMTSNSSMTMINSVVEVENDSPVLEIGGKARSLSMGFSFLILFARRFRQGSTCLPTGRQVSTSDLLPRYPMEIFRGAPSLPLLADRKVISRQIKYCVERMFVLLFGWANQLGSG